MLGSPRLALRPCTSGTRHLTRHLATSAHRATFARTGHVVHSSARYHGLEVAVDTPGSFLSVAANKELTRAATVEELEYTYQVNESNIAVVGMSTTWVQLARLYNPGRNDAASKAMARRILGRTLRFVPDMDLRSLSNVIWGIGKIKLKLEDEAIGHHLAAEVEARIRELLGRDGMADARDAAQLWLGLAGSGYKWSEDLLLEAFDCTLAEAAGPEWTLRDLSFVMKNFYILERYKPKIHANKISRLESLIDTAVASEEDDNELIRSAPSFTHAADTLGLRLAPDTLIKLRDAVLLMPPFRLKELGRHNWAATLYRLIQRGFPPTPEDVDTWAELLLQDLGGRWSDEELVWTAAALAACPSFNPPQELKQRVRDTLATRGDRLNQYKRSLLLDACKAWGIPLPAKRSVPAAAASRGRPRGAVPAKRK